MLSNILSDCIKKILCFISFIGLFTCLLPNSIFADDQMVVKNGDPFPNISLTCPLCPKDKKYLGLSEKKSYSLNNIPADFVLVEFFSIYCPVCQTHADKFNRLHNAIERDDVTRKNLRMIGIGTGNNNTEVEYFKKYFNIIFPCIADPDFKIHKALHEPRTPLLVLVDKRSAPYKVVSVLDFSREPEILMQIIREEIQTRSLRQKTVSSK